jgi:hypothetical protein
MERELGVSYWTIRGKLNEVITQLGFENPDLVTNDKDNSRREILEKVDQGEITVTKAAEMLAEL